MSHYFMIVYIVGSPYPQLWASTVAMTLEPKNILKEGWLTLFKNKKTGIFNSKPAVSYFCRSKCMLIVHVVPICLYNMKSIILCTCTYACSRTNNWIEHGEYYTDSHQREQSLHSTRIIVVKTRWWKERKLNYFTSRRSLGCWTTPSTHIASRSSSKAQRECYWTLTMSKYIH